MQLKTEKRRKAEKNVDGNNCENLFKNDEHYKYTQKVQQAPSKIKTKKSIPKPITSNCSNPLIKRKILRETISKNDTLYSERQR